MKKYSKKWKMYRAKRYGGWAQDRINSYGDKVWEWHYIQYGTEYNSGGKHYTKTVCVQANKN